MKNNVFRILLCMSVPLWIISCKEKETTGTDAPVGTFRPINFILKEVVEDQATFSWVAIANATYSLEYSRDSMVFQNDLKIIKLNEAVREYTIDGLWSGERYSVRIKAINNNPDLPESGYAYTSATNPTFVVSNAGIFTSSPVLETVNGIVENVTLTWNSAKEVERISFSVGGVEVASFPISAEEKELGRKTIVSTLSVGTAYTFRIFREDMRLGEMTVIL